MAQAEAAPGSPGYPAPQGYLRSQEYPPAQERSRDYAAPRGYPPGDAQGGYPLSYRSGTPPAALQVPASMVTAVRLMYAGAVYSLVSTISIVAVNAGQNSSLYTSSGNRSAAGAAAFTIVVGLVEAALWLRVARGCRRGRRGSRRAGTVLFGLYTLGVLSVVGSSEAGPGAKVVTLVGWLIGLAAVVALWRRASSAFFHDVSPRG